MCFRELLDCLRKVGFKLTEGEDSGFLELVFKKAGGYYFGKSFFI